MDNQFLFMLAKLLFVVVALISVVPIMLWVERRGAALMQNRLGPNRAGPFGLLQALADMIKFFWKEDGVPGHVRAVPYLCAPLVSLAPAFMTFAVIPFAGNIIFNNEVFEFQVAHLDVGFLYIFAIASLGVYGIVMAGWASQSAYAMMGALRSASQLMSYELPMGLSVIGVILAAGSFQLQDIVALQSQELFHIGSLSIPKLGIFIQPLGFLIFLTCAFAETNRLPFDLAEGESELIAGYHIEYGAMKFAMFMMAEYINMTTASGLIATLYFGGFQLLPGMHTVLDLIHLTGFEGDCLRAGFQMLSFGLKIAFFMWFFVWVRWTLPRFRYDQLMDLGWKVLMPLAMVNIALTVMLVVYKVI